MQRLVLFFLVSCQLLLFSTAFSQTIEPYNKALIWRGFEHTWTYNHRINRIGNHVSLTDTGGYSIHSSATGIGSDSTLATTYYTYLESPDVYFKETKIKIQVQGHEGDLLTKLKHVNVKLDDWMQDKDHYEFLVNGFEIKSVAKADQIELFRFFVEDPIYHKAVQELELTAHFNLVTNCRTMECQLFNNKTFYELTLYVLVVAFDEDKAEFANSYTTRNYVWGTETEVEDLNKKLKIEGQKKKYPFACIGIKGLGIVLNEEHWLLELDHFITPLDYDMKSGTMDTYVNMKFAGWNIDMQQNPAFPFKAKFSSRKPGFCLLDANINLIQMANAKIKHGQQDASLFWIGKNTNASSEDSESIQLISDLKFDKK